MNATGGVQQAARGTDYLAGVGWDVYLEEAEHPGTADHPGRDILTGATLPTTAAAVIAAIDGEAAARERDYDAETWWFRTVVDVPVGADLQLDCAGLATLCEVWIDGDLAAESESMFAPVRITLHAKADRMTIALRFRSLTEHLSRRRPRGRWRSAMVAAQGLRWVRTTMLGRAPVYHGAPPPVGPWRPITLTRVGEPATPPRLRGRWRDGRGELSVRANTTPGGTVTIDLAGTRVVETADADGVIDTVVTVTGIAPWWPHTHGEPVRHRVLISDDNGTSEYRVGFRDVRVDYATGGFGVAVNGVPVFCRGACWVPVDTIGFDDSGVRDLLEAVRDAGANMVRVVGTMVYESPEFYELCSELGILVWQDVMVATIDPPADDDFETLLRAEIDAFLDDNGHQAALAVISGGSETDQQPTMLGLSAEESRIPFSERDLPELLRRDRMAVGYVPSSPTGGDLPTHEGSGVAHYFGIGGYLRPLDDVRTARVRFAVECLAFAVPPEQRSVDSMFGSAAPAGHAPEWKSGVPRDRGSSWDFEDVRDHYVRTLFGVEPSLIRRDDPDYYLDLGRAAICEAVETAYSYWRGSDSGCDGALMLALRDPGPGAGWGLVDVLGVPKAPWYPWARTAAPVAILFDDRGLDGLRITVCNDRPETLTGRLVVGLHTIAGLVPVEQMLDVTVPPHETWTGTVDGVLGRFTDATHSHRFGRRGYEAVVARLDGVRFDGTGVAAEVAPAIHLVGGPQLPLQNAIGLAARCVPAGDEWILRVSTDGTAQYVVIDAAGYRPSDNWFHLAPGSDREVTLRPLPGTTKRPTGRVRALNSVGTATIDVLDDPNALLGD